MSDESYIDLRIRRTRKSIRNAFILLLEDKSFTKISVNAITQKAEINRATFYLHYKDIHDLIDSILNELLTSFEKILLEKYKGAYKPGDELSSLVLLLEHIEKNATIYKALLVSKHVPFFTPRLMTLINELILDTSATLGIEKAEDFLELNIPSDIAAWYGTSAMVGTISMWLANDMPYSPQILADKMILLNPFIPANSSHT